MKIPSDLKDRLTLEATSIPLRKALEDAFEAGKDAQRAEHKAAEIQRLEVDHVIECLESERDIATARVAALEEKIQQAIDAWTDEFAYETKDLLETALRNYK